MNMKEAVVSAFSKYANFKGRARRSEYWYFVLFNFLVNLGFNMMNTIFEESFLGVIFAGLSFVYGLAVLVPNLAVTWRRLHDIGKGGGWYFICLVPIVGGILLLIWTCRDSQPGDNRFGPNPKEPAFVSYDNNMDF